MGGVHHDNRQFTRESVTWPRTVAEAVRWQKRLRRLLLLEDRLPPAVRLVGGVDAAYVGDRALAVIVVLTYPGLEVVEHVFGRAPAAFPYVPGLLAMREGPAVEAAWQALPEARRPDVLFFDGQGIAHPRGMGIAAHMGVLFDRPAVGVAKRLLVGRHEPVPDEAGAWRPLLYRGRTVGAAVRTRAGVKPVYVSPGHRLSVPTAVHYVLATARGYKLPEPIRLADRLVRRQRQREEET